jgi:hypothetical protein
MKIIHIANKITKESAYKVTYEVDRKDGKGPQTQEKVLKLPSAGAAEAYVTHLEKGKVKINNVTFVEDTKAPSSIKERVNKPSVSRPRNRGPRIDRKLNPIKFSRQPKAIVNQKESDSQQLFYFEAAADITSKDELYGAWAENAVQAKEEILNYLDDMENESSGKAIINPDFDKAQRGDFSDAEKIMR